MASLYSASFLNLIFYSSPFMGCLNLISISGKSWILSIILIVDLLFLANSAQSFNRGSREGYNTFKVCEKDLIYHQSEGFQILQLCFLMLLVLMRN